MLIVSIQKEEHISIQRVNVYMLTLTMLNRNRSYFEISVDLHFEKRHKVCEYDHEKQQPHTAD